MASDYSLEFPLPVPARDGEAELVSRAAAGDQDAYAALLQPHEAVAYRVAVSITGSSSAAQEAVQNACLKAYRSLRRFRRGAAFRPWLVRIVINESHNVRRAEQRHERLAARAAERREAGGTAPDEAVVAREEVATVLRGLRQLTDGDRLVLALRYFAELPDDEAAALAGASVGAYRVRLVRARKRLLLQLEDRDD
jgi:RNA polymerase sigma-70 factor (ECF subfamily)